MQSYRLSKFESYEIRKAMLRTEDKYRISRKYFEIYQMVGNISIDGFKRERYVVKVRDITEELTQAYRRINEEESKIENTFVERMGELAEARERQQYSVSENKGSYSTEKECNQFDHEPESYMESLK